VVVRVLVAAILASLFAAIALALPDRGGTALDVLASDWLQTRATDAGSIVFTWISWLGDTALPGLLLAAVIILVYRRRKTAAATVVIASVGAPLLDAVLKRIFQRGRPEEAIEFITGMTWSFPSGHAMSSLVGYSVVAYFRLEREEDPHRRRVIVLSTGLIILAVGFSRLYLGVHFLSDIAGGWLAGAVWLLACLEVYRFTLRARTSIGSTTRD
jgi:undecaprenyl-diphosphatase